MKLSILRLYNSITKEQLGNYSFCHQEDEQKSEIDFELELHKDFLIVKSTFTIV